MVKAFPPDCDLVLADRMDLALATPCSHLTCGLPMLARVPVLPLVVLSLPPPESLESSGTQALRCILNHKLFIMI